MTCVAASAFWKQNSSRPPGKASLLGRRAISTPPTTSSAASCWDWRASVTSLVFNIIGSLIFNQHPLQLIRVYLTFPLGDAAVHVDSGLALAVGCRLYLFTGMVLGIPFQVVLAPGSRGRLLPARFAVTTAMALAIWLFNFYGILSWLQPLLLGGDWIVAEIPWWVAALTHLVFGWTMLLVEPLGEFVVATPSTTENP